ncbi:hypothetical protein ACQ4PT_027894 [Festuca glaucescens]
MFATHGNRRRRERGVHAPLVLLCSIGDIVFLANARHVLFPKESFLGSFWSTTTNKPQGVKYELHTLPVDAKDVADGDTVTVYVDMPNPHESGNVPREVQEAVVERIKARVAKNYQKADTLQKIIVDAGYRQVPNLSGEQVLAKKYRIRLRGIDAPENSMPYGKEAKEELVKLVQGRTLKISVYDTDRYGRLVGDVECNGVFVQEHMLKKGLAWHYTAYDRRQELAKWESQTRASRLGLWALPNPEKPWEWRKEKCMRKCTGSFYREGGADIHDVFVEKSVFRVLLSCIGAALLLGNVCCALLSKETLFLGSFWSVSFSAIIAKWLQYKPVKKESLMIMPAFGIQLEQHFWSGRVHRQFVPIRKLLKPLLNECVTPVTCYWSLALLLRDEDELMLVFKKLHPPVKMLVPIWKALCAFMHSDGISPSVVSRPDDLHEHVDQDGAVES